MPKSDLLPLKAEMMRIAYRAKEGHIASSFSVLDIIWVLHSEIMTEADTFILSKGHAALGLYAVLRKLDIAQKDLATFCQYDSPYGGHPTPGPGVPFATGSLGHGLPLAVGLALAKKMKGEAGHVFVLVGDQELNEGTCWEAALLGERFELSNLTCIVDHNDSGRRSTPIDYPVQKFGSFGWNLFSCHGHDHDALAECLEPRRHRSPTAVICNTTKGEGSPEMENNPNAWHHKVPATEVELEYLIANLR